MGEWGKCLREGIFCNMIQNVGEEKNVCVYESKQKRNMIRNVGEEKNVDEKLILLNNIHIGSGY